MRNSSVATPSVSPQTAWGEPWFCLERTCAGVTKSSGPLGVDPRSPYKHQKHKQTVHRLWEDTRCDKHLDLTEMQPQVQVQFTGNTWDGRDAASTPGCQG